MDAKLRIATDLSLNAEDFLVSAVGIIGKRGKGKSGLVKVLMEELVRVSLPFVMFDPVGIAWGLRSSIDGKGPGLDVLVVGGPHQDVRLDARGGAQVARAIVQANVSCIVDFSESSKHDYRQFIADFSHELFHINEGPRLVILEEAPELVPQRLRPDMTTVFEAVERLVSRGRNKGIGVVMVSQRMATLNKDVVSQVDALFVFGLAAPQDRKALGEWVEGHGQKEKLEQFDRGIAELGNRECWFWAPDAFGTAFRKIRVRDFTTFHPDKTHLMRTGLLAVKPVTTDVSAIVAKLGKEMEKLAKAKEEAVDAKKLRAEVDRLTRALEAERAHSKEADGVSGMLRADLRKARTTTVDPVRIQKLQEQNEGLRQDLAQWKKMFEGAARLWRRARSATELLVAVVEEAKSSAIAVSPTTGRTIASMPKRGDLATRLPTDQAAVIWDIKPREPPAPMPRPARQVVAEVESGSTDFSPTRAHLKILSALAWLHGVGIKDPSKVQLALWSGYSPNGGGYNNYLGALRGAGLIDYRGPGTVFLTDRGQAVVDSIGNGREMPTTPQEMHEQVFRMVGESKARILRVLIQAYPDPVPRTELAERCDPPFSAGGGGYANYLGSMRSMGLIEYIAGGVVATPYLFLEG